jgi:hypothetical protein
MKTFTRLITAARALVIVLACTFLALSGIAPAHAATRAVRVSYISLDGLGNIKYQVLFRGTVRSEGPSRYVVEGELDAYCGPGALTKQSATFGYGSQSGSWQYKSFWCNDLPQDLVLRGERKEGEGVDLIVGATSGVFNTYNYGDKVVVTELDS